jgi:hypothetical protein
MSEPQTRDQPSFSHPPASPRNQLYPCTLPTQSVLPTCSIFPLTWPIYPRFFQDAEPSSHGPKSGLAQDSTKGASDLDEQEDIEILGDRGDGITRLSFVCHTDALHLLSPDKLIYSDKLFIEQRGELFPLNLNFD